MSKLPSAQPGFEDETESFMINRGTRGAVILALTMVLLTVLLVLVYFFLFLYNRLKHPEKDQTGKEDAMAIAMDTIKFATNSEAQNPLVLTKDDLQGCDAGHERSSRFDVSSPSPQPPSPPQLLREKTQPRSSGKQSGNASSEEWKTGGTSDESSGTANQSLPKEEKRVREDSMDQKFNSFVSDPTSKPAGFTRLVQAETGEKKRRHRMRQIEQDYTEYLQREMDSASKRIIVTAATFGKEQKNKGQP